jgi:hypothetical protein
MRSWMANVNPAMALMMSTNRAGWKIAAVVTSQQAGEKHWVSIMN